MIWLEARREDEIQNEALALEELKVQQRMQEEAREKLKQYKARAAVKDNDDDFDDGDDDAEVIYAP